MCNDISMMELYCTFFFSFWLKQNAFFSWGSLYIEHSLNFYYFINRWCAVLYSLCMVEIKYSYCQKSCNFSICWIFLKQKKIQIRPTVYYKQQYRIKCTDDATQRQFWGLVTEDITQLIAAQSPTQLWVMTVITLTISLL